ncbi:Glutathione S-transferase, C-terminal-like protein [Naviculisporaceae sp. PSN 640]
MPPVPKPQEPIVLWITPPDPTPWAVFFLLQELKLNCLVKSCRPDDLKKPPFIDINPYGLTPAIEDPNTNLTLWETGAIFQYIIETYDTEHRLSYTTPKERALCNQWLFFQASEQTIYYSQAGWWTHIHTEKVPSVIERHHTRIKRILGVTERVLSKKGEDKQWLVGDKMTFADMAFVTWNCRLVALLGQSYDQVWEGFPRTRAWHEKMARLPSWNRALAWQRQGSLMDQQGLK